MKAAHPSSQAPTPGAAGRKVEQDWVKQVDTLDHIVVTMLARRLASSYQKSGRFDD